MPLALEEPVSASLEQRVVPTSVSEISQSSQLTSPLSRVSQYQQRQEFASQFIGRTPASLTSEEIAEIESNGYRAVAVQSPRTFNELEALQQDSETYDVWITQQPITGFYNSHKGAFEDQILLQRTGTIPAREKRTTLPSGESVVTSVPAQTVSVDRWTIRPIYSLEREVAHEVPVTVTSQEPESLGTVTYRLAQVAGRVLGNVYSSATTSFAESTLGAYAVAAHSKIGKNAPLVQQGATMISALFTYVLGHNAVY